MIILKRNKGKQTECKIMDVAKNIFYEKGYHKTSMKEIAETAEIAPGNLTYYFPTKDALVSEIFNQYLSDIFYFAINKIPKSRNPYYKHFYVSMIFNTNIFNDAKTTTFYYETLQKKSLKFLMHHSIDHVYKDFKDVFNLPISKIQFEYITAADYGARREVLLKYIETHSKMPPKDLAIMILSNTSRLFGIKELDLFRASYEAYVHIDAYDFSSIKLLR